MHVMKDTHPTIDRRRRDDRARGGRARLHDRGPVPDRDGRDPAERRARSAPESIVAAGALVVEGMQVPPRSLVMGSPAKVKRPLTDAEVAEIQMYADRYVGYRLDYMNGTARAEAAVQASA